MGYMDEYNKLKKKRLGEETKVSTKTTKLVSNSYMDEYNKLNKQRTEAAGFDIFKNPVAVKEKIGDSKKEKEAEKAKETDDRKWYQKGHFEDGWDFGDVTKSILGVNEDTADVLDLTWNSAKRGYYNARYGEETFAAMSGQKNEKDVYKKILSGDEYQFTPGNGLAKGVSGAFELMGQMFRQSTNPRTVAVASGAAGAAAIAGQLGPQVLLPEEIVTVPTAFGAGLAAGNAASALEIEAGHAYNELIDAGVNEKTSRNIALAVGTVNAGLEALQVDELVDAYRVLAGKSTTKSFVKRIAEELIDRGVDVAKETAQEVMQEGVTVTGVQLGSKLENGEWAYSAEDVTDRLWDTAKSSALSFGVMNAPATAKNISSITKDSVTNNNTNLTENEQKVVDKVYDDALAEKEKNGKLSNRDKNKLYESVVKDMEQGRIDTDTIESVLGGESYSGYQSMVEQETKIKDEINALENTPETQFTVKQRERLTELREQLEGIDTKTAKSNLFSEVDKLTANDTKLRESYNEKARRGQAFEADLTKYDAKQQETIKKAVESGILNNTNRTHEFVDLVAKVSADKGVLFDFTNNQKLKESGFAIDGKQVNGYVTKDGITINVNSAKSLDTVVGHEITHVLEGTELYNELQTAIVEYAKSKNDYQGRYDTLAKLYENIEGANIDAELTAELVGDYIFTDTDFIHNLSTNNRNVFQKIYDEVKYLYKVATAGSKEARELERVKKVFDEAYRGETKNTADGGVQYALSKDINGNVFVDVTEDIFDSNNGESVARTIQKVIAEKFNNLIEANGQKFQINKTTNDEFRRSESATKLLESSPVAYNDKLKTIANADEILTAAKNWIGEATKHTRKDDIVEFGRGNVMYRVGENGYVADVLVGIRKNGSAVLYDLVNIYETKIAEAPVTMASNENSQRRQGTSADEKIPQNTEDVKAQFSLSNSLSDRSDVPPTGKFLGKDIALETAPVAETTESVAPVAEAMVDDYVPGESLEEQLAKADETLENLDSETEALFSKLYAQSISDTDFETQGEQSKLEGFEQEQEPERLTRAKLHSNIMNGIKSEFAKRGIDFDEVLKNAKRMHTVSINDNTPQRVNDKTFGYEAGEVLNELTFNRVALRESNGIKWLNGQVDTIRELSKKYKIKPRSKESAAAQMYAEGFWVNDKDEIIAYGDAELAQDFPDVKVRNRIKALANDPTIRKIYDDTLDAINESRKKNAYPEIPRLENYYLHFRAMDDTFSRLGVPFNPNDIKARDLPTDVNGTTIDRKPGQPFFTSAFHREGKRTSFDMLDGIERYLNSAKNQIYHIDDIQTTRALWGYIADRFGQAHGLENLDHMELEAQQEHIQQVYDGHLSNYARFLVEYANNLAGKTALIDRGVEGLIGRRALQFINTVNTQAGRNQVGFSLSSPFTNIIPSMEAIARTSKQDSIKAFAQTVSNVFHKDGFVESDPTLIRRKGADKFSKTLWEKMSDPGYILMGAVDNVTSEFIVRTKYNELTRKGMDSKQAHIKAGEWASRIMGDRSYGQMPLYYNSKMLGLFTKYQLEVRNALDSMFYDTFQEAKANSKDIENQIARNAVVAAKYTYKIAVVSLLNHLFGQAFEKIIGYNPAFDIISTIATLFGLDDDEEDEDTFGDNAEQAFKELLGDLPYTSLFTDGGRIPIGSAMPIKQLISGVDKYGNEKSRLETIAEAAPYYLLPGGYGQIKKTTQGLGMFSDEHPVSGSYTDSGNLRYPVEDTLVNKLQAAAFGQYASANARDYFDNERSPLKEKQIQEYIDVDIPIQEYWDYREGLAKLKTNEEKVDYIDSLDLPLSKKNILVNNVLDRKEDVDLEDYSDYESLEEFDFATKYPEKYRFFEEIGVTYNDYKTADDDAKDAYNWAFQNPEKHTLSKAISDDVVAYRSYTKDIYNLSADKDENGKSISGSKKEKVFAYIESLPIDYGQKCILFKSQYKADDSMNMDIIEYLDSREDIDYDEMVTILRELDFTVEGNNVYWD